MSDSTPKARPRKPVKPPKKPYSGFPLAPHASGKWCKKINGVIRYFGNWKRKVKGEWVAVDGGGSEDALKEYNAQKDDWHAGRTPAPETDKLLVKELCNHFLTAMTKRLEQRRKMSPRQFKEYKATCVRLVRAFGEKRVAVLVPDDFAKLMGDLAQQYGPVRLGNEVQKVRTVFKWGTTNDLIRTPINFGSEFVKPDRTELRLNRAKRGKKMFEAAELRALIDAADVQLKAMVLLGINCAFNNSDCGRLPQTVLDLEGGWVTFPRPKTGIERRAKLWPETVAALMEAVAQRPAPKDKANTDLVFITKYGNAWTDDGYSSSVTHETTKVLEELGIKRPGVNFGALRHTFRTVADATRDIPASRLVMGHADDSIDAVYRESIDDARLVAVAEHVRGWLFGKPGDKGEQPANNATIETTDDDEQEGIDEPATLRLFMPEGGAA